VADTGAMVVFAQHTISLIVRTNAGRGFSCPGAGPHSFALMRFALVPGSNNLGRVLIKRDW
jgi:hypothetical protein